MSFYLPCRTFSYFLVFSKHLSSSQIKHGQNIMWISLAYDSSINNTVVEMKHAGTRDHRDYKLFYFSLIY